MIFKEHIKDVGYRPIFSGGELRDKGIQPKSTGKGFLYTWNANGSLRSVTNLEGVTYRFRYDAFGRRLEKRRMASTFRFVWDGNVLLHETFKKDNSEHTELTTWVFEGFVPTAKLVNGKAYSIISDHLGTPILAVDSDGMEVWNRQLDICGRVKREIKASSLGDDVRPFIPFLYQGQYYDFETNLAYNRFRYYSPETGAYISQDPIGLAGGNPTLYGYVKDSNCWVDVFGLDCSKLPQPKIGKPIKRKIKTGADAPKKKGVYIFEEGNTGELYKGSTDNFRSRMNNHLGVKLNAGNEVTFIPVKTSGRTERGARRVRRFIEQKEIGIDENGVPLPNPTTNTRAVSPENWEAHTNKGEFNFDDPYFD